MKPEDDDVQIARERSPSFPYIDLPAAIEHVKKLYESVKMNEVRIDDVAHAWNMAPKSGSMMRYLSAVGQYELVDASGSGEQRRIRVSAVGRRILEDGRPGVRETLCSEAALKPRLIRGLFFGVDNMPHWGRDRPADRFAESTLRFDFKFTSDAARRFIAVYDATIPHVIDEEEQTEKTEDNIHHDVEVSAAGSQTAAAVVTPGDVKSNVTAPAPISAMIEPSHNPTSVNQIFFKSSGPGLVTINATLDLEGLRLLEEKINAFRMLLS